MVFHLNGVGEIVANELPELFPELARVSWGAEEKKGSKELLEACNGLHLGHILKVCNPLPIIFKETSSAWLRHGEVVGTNTQEKTGWPIVIW